MQRLTSKVRIIRTSQSNSQIYGHDLVVMLLWGTVIPSFCVIGLQGILEKPAFDGRH